MRISKALVITVVATLIAVVALPAPANAALPAYGSRTQYLNTPADSWGSQNWDADEPVYDYYSQAVYPGNRATNKCVVSVFDWRRVNDLGETYHYDARSLSSCRAYWSWNTGGTVYEYPGMNLSAAQKVGTCYGVVWQETNLASNCIQDAGNIGSITNVNRASNTCLRKNDLWNTGQQGYVSGGDPTLCNA